MGTNSSNISHKSSMYVTMLKHKALLNYIEKLNNYDENINGSREDYKAQVEADYQVEYIPENHRSK